MASHTTTELFNKMLFQNLRNFASALRHFAAGEFSNGAGGYFKFRKDLPEGNEASSHRLPHLEHVLEAFQS